MRGYIGFKINKCFAVQQEVAFFQNRGIKKPLPEKKRLLSI
jgi:hypothetical protein